MQLMYNKKTKKWIGTSKKWKIIKKNIDLNKQKKKYNRYFYVSYFETKPKNYLLFKSMNLQLRT